MHTVFALLCFVVVIHWLIFPYPSGLLHWHCGNLTIAPVPAKQPWWIWINTSCELIMNDCITTTKQSTTKPCAYFLGYTVWLHLHEDELSLQLEHGWEISPHPFVRTLLHEHAVTKSSFICHTPRIRCPKRIMNSDVSLIQSYWDVIQLIEIGHPYTCHRTWPNLKLLEQ